MRNMIAREQVWASRHGWGGKHGNSWWKQLGLCKRRPAARACGVKIVWYTQLYPPWILDSVGGQIARTNLRLCCECLIWSKARCNIWFPSWATLAIFWRKESMYTFFFKHTLFFSPAWGCLPQSRFWASSVLRRVLNKSKNICIWNDKKVVLNTIKLGNVYDQKEKHYKNI